MRGLLEIPLVIWQFWRMGRRVREWERQNGRIT